MRVSSRVGRVAVGVAAGSLLLALAAGAQGQSTAMPGVSQMSGVPLPAGDLPAGAVSVRLVRGSLGNNIAGHPVELHGGPSTLTEQTDENGRAQFVGVTPGTTVHAAATVDGAALESQKFPVPATGGIRLVLVAPDAASAERAAEDARLAAAPPEPGIVVLGGESQFVVELEDDELEVYYLLHILNNARTPVATDGPLIFDLPQGARNANVLEGSSSLATANGPRVTVTGPFPPGRTLVQVGYQLPTRGTRLTIEQRLPAMLERMTLVAEKTSGLHLTSPQMESHGEMPADGKTYLVANGLAIAAGQTLTLQLEGLPHRATWPRTLALVLAVAILAIGGWAATHPGHASAAAEARRRKLEGRRDRLFADLVRLEEQRRSGQVDAHRHESRRRELMAQLERIYGELDEDVAA